LIHAEVNMLRGAGAVELVIPAKLEFLDLVDNVVEAVNELMHFDEEERTAVSISVVEAGTNAIQHGCRNGGECQVQLSFLVEKDTLTVVVHDPGPGFDPGTLPDPTSPENLLRERGRGIFIMRQMMDEVEFGFDRGTTVRLVKRRPRAVPA
jgi:serine/threonine-protein kinase RsbW